MSAVPRDMAQALLRVRTLRDRRVVVTLRDTGTGGGPEPTLASLRADERARDALLRQRDGDEARAPRACPRWLTEAAVAGRHYRALWEHYARWARPSACSKRSNRTRPSTTASGQSRQSCCARSHGGASN